MLRNNYLAVLGFQLKLNLMCNSKEELLVLDDCYHSQIKSSINIIREKNPDLVIYPEMSYHEDYHNQFTKLSKGRIIVAGSKYINGINTTMIYQNGALIKVIKRYSSGAEPMTRISRKITSKEFLAEFLTEHEFWIKGKKLYILNCMEYYNIAYYIAREEIYSKDLFGFIAICSNSNTKVFKQESTALHNHNEDVYSFVINTISMYNGKPYGDGQSYVYGPIQAHEKSWLEGENIKGDDNNSSILNLSKESSEYFYGKFYFGRDISRFGRSDCYINNPAHVIVEEIN